MDRNVVHVVLKAKVDHVVPYVGTWIEIASCSAFSNFPFVVPYVGTWIEIILQDHPESAHMSFPTWERG